MDDTASTTISQALMLLIIWGFPCEVSVPSFRRMIGACCSERGVGRRRGEEEGGGGRRRGEGEGRSATGVKQRGVAQMVN